ncbi:hypothetical protein ACXX84_01650 [Mycoplasma sp. AC157]
MKFKNRNVEKILENKFLWFIIIIIHLALIVFAFLNIKGLTTIYSYTIGLLFGNLAYSYFLIVFILCIIKLSTPKIIFIKNFKIDLFLISLFLIFVNMFVSFIVLEVVQYEGNFYFSVGANVWNHNFQEWWNTLAPEKVNSSLPNLNHLGFINIFLYSVLKSTTSVIGVILVPLVAFITYLLVKILIFMKKMPKIKKNEKNEEKIVKFKKKKINQESTEDKEGISKDEVSVKQHQETYDNQKVIDENKDNPSKNNLDLNETLPFENPFD